MTNFTRRDFVLTSAGGGAYSAMPSWARAAAADYPQKDITFIIPYNAGGGYDIIVRVVAPAMEKYLPHKTHILPTNEATSGGGKALGQLYRAKPDGYTIGIFGVPGLFLLLKTQGAAVNFDYTKFTYLGTLGPGEHYGIAVRADSPFKTIADMKAASMQQPVSFASTGPDGTGFMTTIISTKVLGINSKIIPGYRGANDYIVATIRGDSDACIGALSTLRPYQQQKSIRILASFEPKSTVPGVPDVAALGKPELSELTLERLVAAPPGLPAPIKMALQDALDKAVRDPAVMTWAKTAQLEWNVTQPGQAETVLKQQAAIFDKWKQYLGPS